jgi:hypothetical protein
MAKRRFATQRVKRDFSHTEGPPGGVAISNPDKVMWRDAVAFNEVVA